MATPTKQSNEEQNAMDDKASLQCIMNLQAITESIDLYAKINLIELLFSMQLPKDISEKYNYLKQQTFQTLGLPFNPALSTYIPDTTQSIISLYNSFNRKTLSTIEFRSIAIRYLHWRPIEITEWTLESIQEAVDFGWRSRFE